MSALNTLLNNPFAAADIARQAYAQVLRSPDAVTEQLKNTIAAEQNTLKPGSTITARYQYQVAQDGSLVPTQTQITTEANEADEAAARDGNRQQRRPGNFLSQFGRERRQTFGDIAKPRALLSPSEELELFAATTDTVRNPITAPEEADVAQTVASATLTGEAVDEQGSVISVEILSPQGQTKAETVNSAGSRVLSLAARAQASVAGLYARNSDVIFNVNPLAQLAA